jgi:hypothetical protein
MTCYLSDLMIVCCSVATKGNQLRALNGKFPDRPPTEGEPFIACCPIFKVPSTYIVKGVFFTCVQFHQEGE